MVKKLITGGCLWMLSEAELFQTGGLAGLGVDLEQVGLVVKKLIRSIQEENKDKLEENPCLKSQGFEMNEIGRNLVKGEGTKKKNGKYHVSYRKKDQGIVTAEKIGTTGIVTEIETGRRRETMVETMSGIGLVTVVEMEIEVVITMIVTGNVAEIATVTGKEKRIMMLRTVTIVGAPVTGSMTMTVSILSMIETGTGTAVLEREIITMQMQKKVGGGPISLNVNMGSMTIMRTKVEVLMRIQMTRVIMTAIEKLIVAMTVIDRME